MINDMKRRVAMAQTKNERPKTKKISVLETITTRSVGIKKEYLKTKDVCRVTFRLPKVAAPSAKSVYIVGDFNNWNIHANPMKKLKDGDFTIKIELKPESEYQFRYLIDDLKWENDWNADKYVKNPYGDSDNSVVIAKVA
jgi:1,4-alpha-glucan branching enzyme